jgi:hypothetical protein
MENGAPGSLSINDPFNSSGKDERVSGNAGMKRHMVGDARGLQERSSDSILGKWCQEHVKKLNLDPLSTV